MRLLLILTIFGPAIFSHAKESRPKVRMFRGRLFSSLDYGMVCENVSTPFRINSLRFEDPEGYRQRLALEFEFFRRIERITKVIFDVKKCDNSGVETCQDFGTWVFGNESCTLMESKHALWTPLVKKVQPPARCPANAGKYSLRNGTVDMRILNQVPVPMEKYFWRAKVEMYDHSLVTCVKAGVRFWRSKNLKD